MLVFIAVFVVEIGLLGLTIWSTRRMPARARARLSRYTDDLPHAL